MAAAAGENQYECTYERQARQRVSTEHPEIIELPQRAVKLSFLHLDNLGAAPGFASSAY